MYLKDRNESVIGGEIISEVVLQDSANSVKRCFPLLAMQIRDSVNPEKDVIQLHIWNALAVAFAKEIKKGARVMVRGMIRNKHDEKKPDTKRIFFVEVSDFKLIISV